MKNLDKIIFVLVSISLIFYVYQFPILYTIDDVITSVFESYTGMSISIPGMSLRLLIPLILIKLFYEKQKIYNKRIIRAFIYIFVGIIISKIFAEFFYPELVNTDIPYEMNSVKLIIRYFTLALGLGTVMYSQHYRVNLLKVLFFTGLALVIFKQFNLFGSSSVTLFQAEYDSTLGTRVGYDYETFGAMDKNYFSLLLGMNIIFALGYSGFIKSRFTRYVLLPTSLILSSIQLVLTMSFGGIISTLIGLIFYFYYNKKVIFSKNIIILPVAFVVFVSISTLPVFDQIRDRISVVQSSLLPALSTSSGQMDALAYERGSGLTTRIGSAFYALNLFSSSPIFGYGGFKDLTSPYFHSGTHTTYIAWMTNFGLITLIPAMMFIMRVLKITRQRILFAKHNDSQEFKIQVTFYSIFILLCFNGIGSPVMLYIIVFLGIAMYSDS